MDEQPDQTEAERPERTGELAEAELEQAAGGIIIEWRQAADAELGQADGGIIIDFRRAKG